MYDYAIRIRNMALMTDYTRLKVRIVDAINLYLSNSINDEMDFSVHMEFEFRK